jgi:hypothetical protein
MLENWVHYRTQLHVNGYAKFVNLLPWVKYDILAERYLFNYTNSLCSNFEQVTICPNLTVNTKIVAKRNQSKKSVFSLSFEASTSNLDA